MPDRFAIAEDISDAKRKTLLNGFCVVMQKLKTRALLRISLCDEVLVGEAIKNNVVKCLNE